MGGKMPKRVEEQRRDIVEKVIEDMETLGVEWSRPWKLASAPHNPVSGTVYRGSNRFMLTLLSSLHGGDPRWCTFEQGKKRGWKLRKGSKSAVIEKWKAFRFSEDGEDDAGPVDRVILKCVGFWSVFNLSQFEGAPEIEPPADHGDDGIADLLAASSRCPVEEGSWDTACYVPSRDLIRIPERGRFESLGSWEAVLLHEMVHSTGHEAALARKSSLLFGSSGYAREELVAELGSMFASADIGIEGSEPRCGERYEQHVAYLKSWIAALKDDPDELYHAAAAAGAAADFVVGRFEERRAIPFAR